VDLTAANEYFSTRLNSAVWDAASDTDKTKALTTAENQLADYEDMVESTRFNKAVCEQAIWLLAGDKRAELQKSGVASSSIGSLSETYNLRHDPTIASQAWAFLRGPGLKAGGLR
jgi:hypothetical protein